MRTYTYILNDDNVCVPCDVPTWAAWFESNQQRRIVEQTHIGETMISTVFIGFDHAFGPHAPRALFETMIFGGACDGHQARYATWDQAKAGHARAVDLVNKWKVLQ